MAGISSGAAPTAATGRSRTFISISPRRWSGPASTTAARGFGVRPGQLRQLDGFLPGACIAGAQERSAAAGPVDGAGDEPARPRADDLDQLLSAVSAGAPDRDARPDVERQGGLQLRDLDGRAGGRRISASIRISSITCATRWPTSSSRSYRAVVVVGRRCDRDGSRARHVRRPRQGAGDRLQGPASSPRAGRSTPPGRRRASPVLVQAGNSPQGQDLRVEAYGCRAAAPSAPSRR